MKRLFPFHHAAWQTTYKAIDEMVNAPSTEEGIRIRDWKDAMLSQLASVGLIGAIMSAVIVGAFAWSKLSEPPFSLDPGYSMICVAWYCSLVFAIVAVATELQQTTFLTRIGCTSKGNAALRKLLSYKAPNGRRKPRGEQIIIWQLANGLLETSIYLWLAGFLVFVWIETRMGRQDQTRENKIVSRDLEFGRVLGLKRR
ncbi:uncharacterized protein BDR25DRAFT_368297 [Lindgomyces ingoldianus]|uniref:Uncharacterized protein n=1 Tax=Lindgomyces ingoldianus TaxID=673940 RepID=A0ACB6QWQ6_9PLEO|nr:uncharacterized protein BDR25DRAFT_368297 [Lindgomyces ingoldianus]KAF2471453.1 hypothetical protein BDR25DRAFT_368297 [Lindgomyces ingoldianus]